MKKQLYFLPAFALGALLLASCKDDDDNDNSGVRDLDFNEHAYADLGLPSGLLWATCNIGAELSSDYGDYFAWAEVEPKESYGWETYGFSNGAEDALTKYCYDSDFGANGFTDWKKEFDAADDAASVLWGGDWRTPTYAELRELYAYCTWTWSTQNKVNGYVVTGPSGISIFLPAAGCCSGEASQYEGIFGTYWTSSLARSYPCLACGLNFDAQEVSPEYDFYRNVGRPIRAVCGKK